MSLEDELDDAIVRSKTGSIAASVLDIIKAVIKKPITSALHVAYAFDVALVPVRALQQFYPWFRLEDVRYPGLSSDLTDLLRKAVRREVVRALLAKAIFDGETILVDVQAVLPQGKTTDICRGCPRSMQCLTENLSTPAECYSGAKYSRYIDFKPERIDGNYVVGEMEHPNGPCRISLLALTQEEVIRGMPE